MIQSESEYNAASVAGYIQAISDPATRQDCNELVAMMQEATGSAPKMWGTSIIGCGTYHYKYASGHEGDTCLIGLSARKRNVSVYLAPVSLTTRNCLGKSEM